jgi:hypothetical protein
MRFIFAAAAVSLASLADAAPAVRTLEVAALGGLSHLDVTGRREVRRDSWNEDLEPSVLFGVDLAYRLGPRTAVEASLAMAPGHPRQRETCGRGCRILTSASDSLSDCEARAPLGCIDAALDPAGRATRAELGPDEGRLRAYHADLLLRQELGRDPVRPFLVAGGGRVAYGGDDIGAHGQWVVAAGAGFLVRLSDATHLRLEAIDHVMPAHFLTGDTVHDVHVRLGLSVGRPRF